MSKRIAIVVLCLFFLLFVSKTNHSVFAADLTAAEVRPERLKTGASPGQILVTFQTDQNWIENGVRVEVGSAWGVSTSASSFTVSTSNLPTGVTAVPGISTATSVSGSQITFPASNLSPNTRYGFFITGGIPTNPVTGNNNAYLWTISTLVAGSAQDSQRVMVPVVANDQIAVNASVGPLISQFEAEITATPTSQVVGPNTTLEYIITYSSTYEPSTPLKLQAEWSLGTPEGSGVPSIAVLEYVAGSSTHAYGGAIPVIDTLNRKITWEIASIPANTFNQTVQFQLKTRNIDTQTQLIEFQTAARIIEPVTTPDSTSMKSYQYISSVIPPTHTPVTQSPTTPSATSAPGPQPSQTQLASTAPVAQPTAVPLPSQLIQLVEITQLSDNSAEVVVRTTGNASVSIQYGSSPDQLDQTIESLKESRTHTVKLSNLFTQFKYYFRVTARDSEGRMFQSELYTFETASQANIFSWTEITGIISHQGATIERFILPQPVNVIYPAGSEIETTLFPIPDDTFEELQLLFFEAHQESTFVPISPVATLPMTNTVSSTFIAKATAPFSTGRYYAYLSSRDRFGNRSLTPLYTFWSAQPFTVTSSRNNQPLELAEVTFYQYDGLEKRYELIHTPSFISQNPIYTDAVGQIKGVFPKGRYKAEIKLEGYQDQSVEFQITDTTTTYPQISLEFQGGVLPTLAYFQKLLQYYLERIGQLLDEVTQSFALYTLTGGFVVFVSVLLSLFSLAARVHITPRTLPLFFRHHWRALLTTRKVIVQGVVSYKNHPISQARISFFDEHDVLHIQILSDKKGRFQLVLPAGEYRVETNKLGFHEKQVKLFIDQSTQLLDIALVDNEFSVRDLFRQLATVVYHGLDLGFELILVLSFVIQLLYMRQFGVNTALPFFLLALLNIAIWLSHVVHVKK